MTGFETHERRQRILHRVVRSPLFWLVTVGALSALPVARAMMRGLPPAPKAVGRVPDFHLVDQTGAPFSRANLDGKVWVADFIFTGCAQSCPVLSSKMESIQKRTKNLAPDFHLVSISVDPDHDTPASLTEYARRYHANPRAWHFLTGAYDDVQQAVVRGFKVAMSKEPAAAGSGTAFDILHGDWLVLVDRHQIIRGYYEANPDGVDRLMEDVNVLVNAPPGYVDEAASASPFQR